MCIQHGEKGEEREITHMCTTNPTDTDKESCAGWWWHLVGRSREISEF